MLYLLLFYWIFAGLFIFGGIYNTIREDNGNLISAFIASIIVGGIMFPIILGKISSELIK